MSNKDLIHHELNEAAAVLNNFLNKGSNITKIEQAALMMSESIKQGGKIFSCGNGGSSCDAMHFAEELTGRFREDREPLPAISISDASHITCTSNDYGYQFVFSRYIQALGKEGDVLLAISTSGNSSNVILAADAAKKKGMKVVALTGKGGGNLGPVADIHIDVEHDGFADRIQEVHIKVIHIFILLIEKFL
jgi:D-sedoheptulose 7-phosphate isomerase